MVAWAIRRRRGALRPGVTGAIERRDPYGQAFASAMRLQRAVPAAGRRGGAARAQRSGLPAVPAAGLCHVAAVHGSLPRVAGGDGRGAASAGIERMQERHRRVAGARAWRSAWTTCGTVLADGCLSRLAGARRAARRCAGLLATGLAADRAPRSGRRLRAGRASRRSSTACKGELLLGAMAWLRRVRRWHAFGGLSRSAGSRAPSPGSVRREPGAPAAVAGRRRRGGAGGGAAVPGRSVRAVHGGL